MYMVSTIMKNYKRVCTWYIHGMYIQGYKHVCTSFRRVCTFLHLHKRFESYKHVYTMYKHVYARFV